MTDIRLHPKFGVNPTLAVCFWCGRDRGDIALLGAGCRTEAPRRMHIDYEPCVPCKTAMAQGFVCIEAQLTPTAYPPMRDSDKRDVYPTGRWAVVKREAAERLLGNKAHGKTRAFVDREACELIGLFPPQPKE